MRSIPAGGRSRDGDRRWNLEPETRGPHGMSELARTPLYDWHVDHGARLVDFAGWSMPVQYTSIIEEHHATRSAAGLFDVSHMGRLRFEGPGAARLLDRLLTRSVADMRPGKVRYAMLVNDQGGILDDVLVYRLLEQDGREFYLLVVNAGNRAKIARWIADHQLPDDECTIEDITQRTAMMAVQGPRAIQIAVPSVEADVAALRYYTATCTTAAGAPAIVSRTGYTGEDGCELIVPADAGVRLWSELYERGTPLGLRPAGLGARDTLRLEAGMPLYGHELTEQINPFQAGLGFAVQLEGREFIGRDALKRWKEDASLPRRVGLRLSGKRVAREHSVVYRDEQPVGEVTSGTFSPTFQQSIAMAYVQPQAAAEGTPLQVDVRGRREAAVVVKLPFYSRTGS